MMITPIHGENYVNIYAMDITERKRAEDLLRESEANLSALIENTDGSIWAVDKQYGLIVGNGEFHKNVSAALGRRLEMGESVLQPNFPPQANAEWQGYYNRALQGEHFTNETQTRFREASHYIEYRFSPIREESGEIRGVTIFGRDITERKMSEELLRENETRLRLALLSAKAGIWEWNLQTNQNIWSEELWSVYGLEPHSAEPCYDTWLKTIHPDDQQRAVQTVQDAARNETELNVEWRVIDKDGTQRWLMSRGQPLRNSDGQAVRFIGTVLDITERKQAEEQLLTILEELKRSNSELEQFAYVASHDLQEPLRAVAGMVQLLQKRYHGQLDERADEYIGLAMDGANRMQTLITDLLEYSRVNRRGNPIQATDANEALRSALLNLHEAIQQSGATVTNGTLPTVEADAIQITQLFQNLIGNAIKFRSENPPQIHIAVEELPDAWHFSVCDNGIGIEPQYFERIFLVFQRLHTRREYPGTGIGLSICKKIVERHGGRIWVESEPGQGTTFHFTIPHRS
jgi:PAS domain S-box-containing protein